MTGYTAGILRERVRIQLPPTRVEGEFGAEYVAGDMIERWAAVDWVRGTKALREGALDAYDTIMVRMRWDAQITRECKVLYQGATYRIQSFHADRRAGTIQMTATEVVNYEL